jgi:queuine tRNA-ribosyltransferase
MTDFQFDLLATDPASRARRGLVHTRRGTVETPAFMPVGTQATVKTLEPTEVAATGAQIVLANTYHLMLRPGVEVIEQAGGVQAFSRWNGPILTDSGGFQIFSLAAQVQIREEGASFKSHIDGSPWLLTPERAVELQAAYRSDIMMALDHVVGYPAEERVVADAMHRTHRWLDRCIARLELGDLHPGAGVLFGIVQGGMYPALRMESAQAIADKTVAGCAIGGLSVGEPKDVLAEFLEISTTHLPAGKPRYLMGVGSPEDLWNGVELGVDMFDCVLPTRLARNAALFTPEGRVNLRNQRFRDLHRPIDEECDCHTCQTYTAAYLHHLYRAEEILGLKLGTIHNLRFLLRQMEVIRAAIEAGTFVQSHSAFLARYRVVGQSQELEVA